MKTYDSYKGFGQDVSRLNATSQEWKSYKRILTLAKNVSSDL